MNKQILLSLFINIGSLIGSCLRTPYKLSYIFQLFQQGISTGRYKSRFKKFGRRSLISHDVELVRAYNIEVGENTEFCPYVVLETNRQGDCDPILRIGDDCQFGEFTHITAINKVIIGNRVLTGRFVLITDNSHGDTKLGSLKIPPRKRELYSKGPVIIEDDVWIGDKATILPNVRIGHNSVIAANSIVTRDVPAFSVVCGTNKILKKK